MVIFEGDPSGSPIYVIAKKGMAMISVETIMFELQTPRGILQFFFSMTTKWWYAYMMTRIKYMHKSHVEY